MSDQTPHPRHPRDPGSAARAERRQQERAAPPRALCSPETLRRRWRNQKSRAFFYLQNGRDVLALAEQPGAHKIRFPDLHTLFAFVTNQDPKDVSPRQRNWALYPARIIEPAEAWLSPLGPTALNVVAGHETKEERAAFFAHSRKVQHNPRGGVKALTVAELKAVSAKALKEKTPAERLAFLREALHVTEVDCLAPSVPPDVLGRPPAPPAPARPLVPELAKKLHLLAGRMRTALSTLDEALLVEEEHAAALGDPAPLQQLIATLGSELAPGLQTLCQKLDARVKSCEHGDGSVREEAPGAPRAAAEAPEEGTAAWDLEDPAPEAEMAQEFAEAETAAEAAAAEPEAAAAEPEAAAAAEPVVAEPLAAVAVAAEETVASEAAAEPVVAVAEPVAEAAAAEPLAAAAGPVADAAAAEPEAAAAPPPPAEPTTAEAAPPPPAEPDPPPRPSARRPESWRRDEIHLPIPYPGHLPQTVTQLNVVDSAALALITVLSTCVDSLRHARKLRGERLFNEHKPVKPVLAARFYTAMWDLLFAGRELRKEIIRDNDVGMQRLDPVFRAFYATRPPPPDEPMRARYFKIEKRRYRCAHDPTQPLPDLDEDAAAWAPLWPVQPLAAWQAENLGLDAYDARLEPDQPVMGWFTMLLGDPLVSESSAVDRAISRLPSLCQAGIAAIQQFFDAVDDNPGVPRDPLLLAQCHALVAYLHHQGHPLLDELEEVTKEGLPLVKAYEAELQHRVDDSAARIVLLGEDQVPKQYLKIGMDAQGRQVALTAETPQLIVIVGLPGYGKTYLMRVIAEAAALHLPGLSTLTAPQRIVNFETDLNNGRTRRQMLEGFAPNRCPQQLQRLYEWYGYKARGNEAYTRAKLLCLPEAVESLKRTLAPLVERGLVIAPAYLGPRDLGSVGYRAIMANARGLQGANKPLYMNTVEAIIRNAGPDLMPAELQRLILASRIETGVKDSLVEQLKFLVDMVREGVQFNDCLLTPDPVCVLLESLLASPDVLAPYQALLINALLRILRDGSNPHVNCFYDEFNKTALNAVMMELAREHGQERRHHAATLVYNGQRVLGMDPGFLSQASLMAVFRLNSRLEMDAVRKNFVAFAGIKDEEFANLAVGECLIGAIQSTGGSSVYRVRVRPTVTTAGGETLRAA